VLPPSIKISVAGMLIW